MEYKFLPLMADMEIRTLLINHANQTGIEMNNYLIRELISMFKRKENHPLLTKMDYQVKTDSIRAITEEVEPYIRSYKFNLDDEDLIRIIRENKNRIYMNESKKIELTSFIGICENHAVSLFSIRNDNYFCYDCYQDKMNNILYNPIRNLILKEFIKSNRLKVGMVAKELKIPISLTDSYYKNKKPISNKVWEPMSKLIMSINEQKVKKNESIN